MWEADAMSSLRIAVVQPALALGEVDRNLRRVEDLVRDAHREHDPRVIVLPEGFTSPNVFAKVLRGTAQPVTGAPMMLLRRLARELDVVLCGGFVAKRGAHAYGTYVLAEPDGGVRLHDKDIPTAWEQHFYVGGDDDGVVRSETLDARVGLMSGWEWARSRTSKRVRDAGVQLVLGGMCWPSFPLNWKGPAKLWVDREHAIWRRQCRELPGQVARITGVPVAHAAHVGPIRSETPLAPGVPWRTQMIGESQVCDRDGTIVARVTLEDGEGHASGEVRVGAPQPLDPAPDRFWIPRWTLSTHAAWYGMNAHGALGYKRRHRAGGFPWQAWPETDLPDEVPATRADAELGAPA
jgi:predicted amidohydrolase